MIPRKPVLLLLVFTVLAPLVLYTDRLGSFSNSSSKNEFLDDASTLNFGGEIGKLNVLPQESSNVLKEPVGIVYSENSADSASNSDELDSDEVTEELPPGKSTEHTSRVLSATDEQDVSGEKNVIEQVTDEVHEENESSGLQKQKTNVENGSEGGEDTKKEEKQSLSQQMPETRSEKQKNKHEQRSSLSSDKVDLKEHGKTDTESMPDTRVRHLRDQLIRAKVFLGLSPIRNNPHYTRELRLRIREVQRVVGDATKDSDLPRNANEKLKAMEQTLAKSKQIQDDCTAVIKKLRAILHSTEEQLRVHKKQTLFLTQLAAKTLPKGLHCLPLRLSTEYYTLNASQQQFPNQDKLENPKLYHYALFSDNILAAAVVVNSTVFHAKAPAKHVFHIVTDRLNYAAMRMWFLANPPRQATIQVQNIEEFTWLNSSYSPVLKQLGTPSMIDYYFRTHKANSDSNLKFRNPKYLSILNHLRFYLPEIFPKLNKVLFLDDDIVVRKDLTALWALNLKGKVNGAVETCGESFHRFDRYLNFSNPLISKTFDPHACGWAYGMNVFDLVEWRKQKITEIYHSWQKLNHDRQLWKLGTLPPGLITFWNRTFALDRSWHVLGLGYNPNVNPKEIERAAVIHYNGNMKPWLEIGMPKYRNYWTKFINYEQVYLRDCNINP
ncbi:probable galacturonosyltransferase 4 [Magnolia sinica]|uniref:probable galacturonosyltransferase 4 n=1 Tax=Magnolia sinica TaxID=86752 RepID=UPI0026583915|nr:probable galacturonosyltransferase 4 [Magnolia sinica]